jgi:hypothetical protein
MVLKWLLTLTFLRLDLLEFSSDLVPYCIQNVRLSNFIVYPVFSKKLKVRLFQFVHIRRVSVRRAYYISSTRFGIEYDVTFRTCVDYSPLCHYQVDIKK